MRSGDTAKRGGADRVDRAPEADSLPALNEIIRAVLMPGRGLARPGFLDQDMIVKQLGCLRCHQVGRDLADRRVGNHLLKGLEPRPVAIVIEEPSRFAGFQVLGSIGARVGHVRLDTLGNQINETGEQSGHQNRTVTREIVNLSRC